MGPLGSSSPPHCPMLRVRCKTWASLCRRNSLGSKLYYKSFLYRQIIEMDSANWYCGFQFVQMGTSTTQKHIPRPYAKDEAILSSHIKIKNFWQQRTIIHSQWFKDSEGCSQCSWGGQCSYILARTHHHFQFQFHFQFQPFTRYFDLPFYISFIVSGHLLFRMQEFLSKPFKQLTKYESITLA